MAVVQMCALSWEVSLEVSLLETFLLSMTKVVLISAVSREDLHSRFENRKQTLAMAMYNCKLTADFMYAAFFMQGPSSEFSMGEAKTRAERDPSQGGNMHKAFKLIYLGCVVS